MGFCGRGVSLKRSINKNVVSIQRKGKRQGLDKVEKGLSQKR